MSLNIESESGGRAPIPALIELKNQVAKRRNP